MTERRSPYTTPKAGDDVRHPLWPELGTGQLKKVSKAELVGRVEWSTGQVSTHAMDVLRLPSEVCN